MHRHISQDDAMGKRSGDILNVITLLFRREGVLHKVDDGIEEIIFQRKKKGYISFIFCF